MKRYADAGVNLTAGDDFSAFAGALCHSTSGNSPFVEVRDFSRGHFRGPRGFRLKNLPEHCWLDASPDGDGTKSALVDAASDYVNASRGFIAMTCGDITRWGGLPLILVNNLEVRSLGKEDDSTNAAFRKMMHGLKTIADAEGLVLYKGETAELGGFVVSENERANAVYLWSGVALGAYDETRIITGDSIESGMVVMALREFGFRNNGISLARKALRARFGDDYCFCQEARADVKLAARSAVFCDRFLTEVNGWYSWNFKPKVQVHALVHITGGGIVSKFAKDILFPRGLSAVLNNLWNPPPVMQKCAEWADVSDRECYEVWNGGQGFLAVINGADILRFMTLAHKHGIEAKVAGVITKEKKPVLFIRSKFRGEALVYA